MKARELPWLLFALGESSFAYLYHESFSDLIDNDLRPNGLDLVQSKANKFNAILALEHRKFTATRKNKLFYNKIKELTGKNGFLIWDSFWEYLVNKDRDKIIILSDFVSEDFCQYKTLQEEHTPEVAEDDYYYHLNTYGCIPMEYTKHREEISNKIADEDTSLRKKFIFGFILLMFLMIISSVLLINYHWISVLVNILLVIISFIFFIRFLNKRKIDRNAIFDVLTERDLDIQNVVLSQIFPHGRNYSTEEIEYDRSGMDKTDYLKVRVNPFIMDKARIKRLKTMIEYGFTPYLYQHINAVDVFEVVKQGEKESHLIKKTKYGEPLEVYKSGNAILILDDDIENSLLMKRWAKMLDLNTLDIPHIIEEYLANKNDY